VRHRSDSYPRMGIIDRIRMSLSPRAHLLAQLARTAGDTETLAANLKRHSDLCTAPAIKPRLEKLAEIEAAQAAALRAILLERGGWPEMPSTPVHDGSSNWERLNHDLNLHVRLWRELNLQLAVWESVEPALAEALRSFAEEEDRNIAVLRDLALKCDPQALN
jgi:hypothetical protein